ncbi:hypothetical protein [Roseomonas sp. USHLN139]|uniref:hypothetical protein n=1 Tax=Roseomonas sp. USHLN139 TaxID=3081298 RepID=UPI003B02D7BC
MGAIGGATPGNDEILGGEGNDVISGSLGNDVISGAEGYDTVVYDSTNVSGLAALVTELSLTINDAHIVTQGVTVEKLGAGNTPLGTDQLVDIEAISASGVQHDLKVEMGSVPAGVTLSTTIELGATSGYTEVVYSVTDAGIPVDYKSLAVYGVTNVAGTSVNDTIIGDAGANTLQGNAGDDVLSGGAGDDRLEGGDGNDVLDGGNGNDTLDGGLGDDTLYGGLGDDTLRGGVGNDVMSGGLGNDTFRGQMGGNDTIVGGTMAGFLDVASGYDTIDYGTDGSGDYTTDDFISLGFNNQSGVAVLQIAKGENQGVDTAIGIEKVIATDNGNDVIDGRTLDLLTDLSSVPVGASMEVDLGSGTVAISFTNFNYAEQYTSGVLRLDVENFEAVEGTARGDTIIGGSSAADLTLNGNGGDDVLQGGLGNDLIDGGAGDDELRGGQGNDTFTGGSGTDTLTYSGVTGPISAGLGVVSGGTTLQVEKQDGSIDNATGVETIIGTNDAHDVINGATLDVLSGAEASLNVDLGANSVEVRFGNTNYPTLSYTVSSFENVEGSALDDVISGGTASASLTLNGNDGDDTITGGANDDSIDGGAGNDTLFGGAGNDVISGGAGNDTLSYANLGAGASVLVTLEADTGTVRKYDQNVLQSTDTIADIETVIGTDGNDLVSVIAGSHKIDAGAGNDILDYISGATGTEGVSVGLTDVTSGVVTLTVEKPGSESDTVTGFETINGSTGTGDVIDGSTLDTLSGANASLNVDLGSGTVEVLFGTSGYGGLSTSSVTYSVTRFEKVEGSSLGDTITGGTASASLTLNGNDGDDTITGGQASDIIDGGAGNDMLLASLGDDTISGGSGNDTLSYANLGANSFISASLGGTADTVMKFVGLPPNVSTDTIADVETIIGTDGNDLFKVTAGSYTLEAGAGDDILSYTSAATGSGGVSLGLDNVTSGVVTMTVEKSGNDADKVNGFETIQGSMGTGDVIDGATLDTLTGADASLNVDLGTGTMQVLFGTSGYGGLSTSSVSYTVHGFEEVKGSNLADTITGGISTDDLTLLGNGGDDILTGGEGSDLIDGGSGNDTIYASLGDDTISGGSGNDTLSYASLNNVDDDFHLHIDLISGTVRKHGDDVSDYDSIDGIEKIIATDGDDRIIMGNGAIEIDGGEGVDRVDYSSATEAQSGLTISLDSNIPSDGIAAGHKLTNIENVIAGAGDDWVIGDVSNAGWDDGVDNKLEGRDGDDILDGGYGDDVLVGGAGNDVLLGGAGRDTADFGDLDVGVEVRLDKGYAETRVTGDATAERDELVSIENVNGTEYDDLIIGDAQDNELYGDDGDDKIEGGAGADFIDGGEGIDTASYANATSGVTASLAEVFTVFSPRPSINTGDAAGDIYVSIENLEGSKFADALYGNSESNHLYGLAGKDALYGNAGDDVLEGGLDADALNGGDGLDIASYENAASAVEASLVARKNAPTTITTNNEASGDTYVSIEGLRGSVYNDILTGNDGDNVLQGLAGDDRINGGAGNDYIDGGEGNDTLNGGDGNDLIIGGAGNDTIDGGTGDDVIIGGAGNDAIDGGAGEDTVIYLDSNVAMNVNLQTGVATGVGTRDTLVRIENVVGSYGDDTLIGDSGNNKLFGADGDDLMIGGAGIDFFDGGEGSDTVSYASDTAGFQLDLQNQNLATGAAQGEMLTSVENLIGGSGNDTLLGDGADNKLQGGAGDDILDGRLGVNILEGGAGNDLLYAGLGQNTLNGGAGNDTVDYSQASAGRTIDLQNGISNGDTLVAIENVNGTNFDDTIIGDRFNNVLRGGDGNDVLHGNKGDDTLDGGAGDNILNGGTGNDLVSYANSAATRVTFVTTDSTLQRYDSAPNLMGTDTLISIERLVGTNNLADEINASYETTRALKVNLTTGTLALTGAATMSVTGFENVHGGALADEIIGSAANNTLLGGGGNDQISGLDGNDFLQGQDGNDVLLGGAGNDVLDGGLGNDSLDGGDGNDILAGGAGDDVLFGGGGDNLLDGGEGIDTVDYSAFKSGRTVDLALGFSSGGGVNDTLTNIENINAGRRDDILIGNSGANRITAGSGNDIITGGLGADALYGEKGDDIFILNSAAEFAVGEIISGGSDYDTIRFATTTAETLTLTSLVTSVEELQISDANGLTTGTLAINVDARGLSAGWGIKLVGNDGANELWGNNDGVNTLLGGGGNDILHGGDLADTLSGGAGNDTLYGGAGNDILAGGEGADILDGGDGIDTADYSGSQLAVSVNLQDLVQGIGGAEGDQLINIENVIGSTGNDFIRGNSVANVLVGGLGDDDLQGFAGDDILEGGVGADTLTGGDGIDTATYRNAGAGVTVDLSVAVRETSLLVNTGEARGDIFFQVENLEGSSYADILTGDSGSNVLTGGAGNDQLFGGGGNDRLVGGTGSDQLTGGTGADTFVFTKGSGADSILDFSAAQNDKVEWTGFGASLDSYAEVSALFQQSGANVVVNAGNGDVLTFANITVANLTADHFLFGPV